MPSDEDAQAVQEADEEGGRVGWSLASLSALSSLLTRYNHGTHALSVMRDQNRGGVMSPQTMQAILWAAYSLSARSNNTNVHSGSPADYTLPANVILPAIGSVPPTPTNGITSGSSCGPTPSINSATSSIGVRSVSGINTALLVLLIGAVAIVGASAMTSSRRKQGRQW